MTSMVMMTLVVVTVRMRKLMMATFFFSAGRLAVCSARGAWLDLWWQSLALGA